MLGKNGNTPSRAGMTLLEVILAIAVSGFVLAAATAFVVSVSNIWLERNDRHFFGDHVDGVTEFLGAAFERAGVRIAFGEDESGRGETANGGNPENGDAEADADPGEDESEATPPESGPVVDVEGNRGNGGRSAGSENRPSAGLLRTADDPVTWKRPPGFARYRDPLLHVRLSERPPLLAGPGRAATPAVHAFLFFEPDEGLSLLWYSELQEATDATDDLRRTPISSLVSELRYIYWDERFERWEAEDQPKRGEGEDQFLLPRFLKLIFEYEGETKERVIALPVPSRDALLF